MSLSIIRCDKCGMLVNIITWNTGDFHRCTCGAHIRVQGFPTLVRPLQGGSPGSTLSGEDQSSCYYHPQLQATTPCDVCGRFLCDLCNVDQGSGHVCPQCLWNVMKDSADERFCVRRATYDSAALALAVIPVTAPLGLYYAIRHWNSPGSILGVRRHLLVAAAAASVVGTALWGYVLVKFLTGVLHG